MSEQADMFGHPAPAPAAVPGEEAGAAGGVSCVVRALLGPGAPEVTFADDHFPDGKHRIRLEFWWDRGLPPLVVIGQNPSKASRHRGDPTVTRCARRAHRMGCGGLVMMNLFAYVATHPADLWASERDQAVEAANLNEIARALEAHPGAPVIFAPGGDKEPAHRERAAAVEAIASRLGRALLCLGTTSEGLPRHPSRCGYAVQAVPWLGKFSADRPRPGRKPLVRAAAESSGAP